MDDSSIPLIEGELDAADKDGFSLIDGSELDDLFVSMSDMGDNKVNMIDGGVNMPERAEKPRKTEKYNLRKSLAWDSAFFTSAGVLDAEELSNIMEGGNGGKHQLQHLPGIQEDVSKSTDSLSTLESDNLTLESLEADLFSDIRASIQRSGESSKSRNSKLNDRLEETSQLEVHFSGKKTSETRHGNMVKPKPTPKKVNTNLQGTGKVMKLGPSREQVRKPVGSKKEPTSCLPKPAAASAKIVMTPAKRMSISAARIKSDNSHLGNEIAAGRVTTVSKGDRPGVPRSTIPKGASHAKSSSVSSTIPKGSSYAKPSSVSSTNTRTGVSSTRSSIDSTSSSSSQSSRILQLNGVQGKAIKPASVSRIPSRVPLKTKNPPTNSRISAKLSASTLSSVSPTSSISEWSSCSSNVSANQEHSGSNECSSLHRTFSLDSNASQDLPSQQGFCGDEEVASAGNVSVSNPVSAKPSGLRMPSPKIGFFDGVKSGGRTQNAVGSKQSRLSSSRLPRSTPEHSSPGGVPNRGKIGNVNVKTTALAGQNTKSNVTSSEDLTKTTSLSNSRVAKLSVGEKQYSSARKKSVTPQGKSKSLTDQVCSAVEADHRIKEMINESIEPNTLDELIKSEEVGNASKVDEIACTTVQCGKCEEATSEKNDPDCNVINISEEEVGNAIKADENADTSVQSEECQADNEKNDTLFAEINTSEEADSANNRGEYADTVVLCQVRGVCEATNEKNDPICAVNNISEEVYNVENTVTRVQSGVYEDNVGNAVSIIDNSDTVSSTVELSGLNEEGNAANFHKQTDVCLSESKPCVRTPFADKNSSPGKFSMEVLVKRFTSLSLDNIQAKEV